MYNLQGLTFRVANDFRKNIQVFRKMYKNILYRNDTVIIEHFVFEEYKSHSFCDQYGPHHYAKDVEGCYRLCERLGLCRVLDVRDDAIVTVMPRYEPVNSESSDFWELLEEFLTF